MLRITMMHVLQGDATIHQSPAKHVLWVGLLYPAVVDYTVPVSTRSTQEGTEIWDSFSSWFESWPCRLLVVLLGHSLPESGLDFLTRILGLMILSMTFLETDALNACEVRGL